MNVSKLRGKIAENSITQGYLAEKMGISENSLSSKMKGKRPFSVDEAKKICELLLIEKNDERAEIFLR